MGLVFSYRGYVLHQPDPETAHEFDPMPYQVSSFGGRIPLIIKGRDVYLGAPNWYHNDILHHHGIDADQWTHPFGYFNGNKDWGDGALKWYGTSRLDQADAGEDEHREVANALMQAGYPITNPNTKAHENGLDDDVWDDDDTPAPQPDLDFWHP